MLRKLMNHELRATGRVMGPMLLYTLLTAVGGNIAVHNLVDGESAILNMLGVFLLIAFAGALGASVIVAFVLMIQRFYKNLLRDEGYLMMTLPVTVHAHVLSKLLVSLIWSAATAVTVVLAMAILMFELNAVDMFIYELSEIFSQLRFSDLMMADYLGHAALMLVEGIALAMAAEACLCLQLYAAMAAGHSFTHHKGLLSVAAWFVFSAAWSALQNGALYLLGRIAPDGIRLWMEGISPFAEMHLTMLAMIAALLIPVAIWYAMTTYFLKNRLNLG